MPKNFDDLVHKRFHIHKSTNILLITMAELMGESHRDVLEAAILYGLAYMNEENKLKLTKWLDQVQLPTIEDVDSFIKQRAKGWDDKVV